MCIWHMFHSGVSENARSQSPLSRATSRATKHYVDPFAALTIATMTQYCLIYAARANNITIDLTIICYIS